MFVAQVDLFFYREPEEVKEKEEEEAVAPPDYGIADFGSAPLAVDQWVPDAQWDASNVAPTAAAASVSNVEWAQEPGWIRAFSFLLVLVI